jgi:hypothetical protein
VLRTITMTAAAGAAAPAAVLVKAPRPPQACEAKGSGGVSKEICLPQRLLSPAPSRECGGHRCNVALLCVLAACLGVWFWLVPRAQRALIFFGSVPRSEHILVVAYMAFRITGICNGLSAAALVLGASRWCAEWYCVVTGPDARSSLHAVSAYAF